MDPDLIRRFLAQPNELERTLKKINNALSNDSPVHKLVNTVTFYLMSSVDEFEVFLADKKDKRLVKFSPEYFPTDPNADEKEEAGYEEEEEEEKVYGYEYLNISVLVNSKTLDLYFEVDHKIVGQPSLSVDDIIKRLFSSFEEIQLELAKDKSHFRNSLLAHSLRETLSPSEDANLLVRIFTDIDGKRSCEIHQKSNALSEAVEAKCTKAVVGFEFLIPFFIDSGSKIEYEDHNWEYLFYFEDKKLVGFLSYYKFFVNFRDFKLRISQLFILPTHQRRGIGSKLVDKVYTKFLADDQCRMITVEDPNNSFLNIQFKILLATAIQGSEANGAKTLFDYLESNQLNDLDKFDLNSLQKKLSLALKSSKNVIATLLDALVLCKAQRVGKKLSFLHYIRTKVYRKLDADSKKIKGKENKKFLHLEGEWLSYDEIKDAIESYREDETPDPNSIIQHRIEALEDLVKNLRVENCSE
jgi:GNAT superfamily N-acetyltransferase